MLRPVNATGRQLLAAAMRREREALQISQEALAHRAGLHRTYVSQVERCTRNVGIDNIERIAGALDISIAELFDRAADE
ncbi:hypothetical protein Dac01nite_12960 [Demequina activiva]|uniref:HTH cro/C1-type domain-containing protein n=1 Tax=Demequina activiva TaxID=1582364 RepID=A0A919Q1Y2_9MICO|nr:hypothetical protein Dac01nite_12960 [Demequina activiva]